MAQTTDARHAAFNDVGRDQYNQYNFGCKRIRPSVTTFADVHHRLISERRYPAKTRAREYGRLKAHRVP